MDGEPGCLQAIRKRCALFFIDILEDPRLLRPSHLQTTYIDPSPQETRLRMITVG